MREIWNGEVIAVSNDTVVFDGDHYFPLDSLSAPCFRDSATRTRCFWKGTARYYDVIVGGEVNRDAAWVYPETTAKALPIRGRVAFWHGVMVEP